VKLISVVFLLVGPDQTLEVALVKEILEQGPAEFDGDHSFFVVYLC